MPHIIFVHGNGDSAALWSTTLWRFESNGWPREKLHALQLILPQARSDDRVAQAGRSSTGDQMQQITAAVDQVRRSNAGAPVVLMGNSRGGLSIRNYIQNGGGDKTVSHAVLGGTPNHGTWNDPASLPGSEFNGASPFLMALNAPQGPAALEVTPGLKWLTIRSDNNDKYAQPDGLWIGSKGKPTNVSFDSPALKGASNVVLPARDHREVSFHPEAFAAAFEFITGFAPRVTGITPEMNVTLNGQVTSIAAGVPTNQPMPGTRVKVFGVAADSGARQGPALVDKLIGADGQWGPLRTDSRTALEFVVEVSTGADNKITEITHIYRSPFLRSSDVVHLRPQRLAETDRTAASVLTFTRPRGYFGLPRDSVLLDGSTAPGIPPGVAGVASSKLKLDSGAGRPVVAEYRSGGLSERLVGVAWPATDGAGAEHNVVLELHL